MNARRSRSGGLLVIRARRIVTLAGETPARAARLLAPLPAVDNGALLISQGRVLAVEPWRRISPPAGACVRDMGEVCLAPACINAHTHLELSGLAGKTRWNQGFAAWLRSLVPLLRQPPDADAVFAACADMVSAGTRHAGNIAGSLQGGLALADAACAEAGLSVSHGCEWFGFGPPHADTDGPWPPRCRAAVGGDPALAARCAPAGHALYSTGPAVLAAARTACASLGRVFFLHLAESPEETQLLASGDGPLRDLYAGVVLPAGWQAPGQRPLAYAMRLGLLGPGTLAVHGAQLDAQESEVLAASGAALCLCPRSNRNLGVGVAPVRQMMENGCLLCLGTDGLSSNRDLDVRREAVWLRETLDVPAEALVRMLTVNGAAALRLGGAAGRLQAGGPAAFCVLPDVLTL